MIKHLQVTAQIVSKRSIIMELSFQSQTFQIHRHDLNYRRTSGRNYLSNLALSLKLKFQSRSKFRNTLRLTSW